MNCFMFVMIWAMMGADEVPAGQAETKQRLEAKTAQLRKLQDEILELGGAIDHSTRVRVTLRQVEIDCVKLKKLGVAHPLMKEGSDPLALQFGEKVEFDSSEALLHALNPAVEKGCVTIVASPAVIAAIGQQVTVTNFRELPFPEPPNKEVPGNRLEVLVLPGTDGNFKLQIHFRVNIEDPQASVKINGKTISAINSRGMQTTISVKPNTVFDLGGGKVSSRERIAKKTPQPEAGEEQFEEIEKVIESHHILTVELLPDRVDATK
ncbi:MAG: hypothetical protein JWP89_6241 [Schlesneria sp.]|nr:hypothetical protein [Schlesneria sp.]